MTDHRIVSGARAFEVQKRAGVDKEGEEVWRTLAYFRSRPRLLPVRGRACRGCQGGRRPRTRQAAAARCS